MPSKAKANTASTGETITKIRKSRAMRRTSALAVIMSISAGPNSAKTAATAQREAKAPEQHQPHRAGKLIARARAIGAAAELLGGIGEAVEEEGADQQKIVEHGVGRERRRRRRARPAR